MAKRIRKSVVASELVGTPHQAGDPEDGNAPEVAFCDVCGKASDELKAGRCPKCFARVIKDIHSARGLGGF